MCKKNYLFIMIDNKLSALNIEIMFQRPPSRQSNSSFIMDEVLNHKEKTKKTSKKTPDRGRKRTKKKRTGSNSRSRSKSETRNRSREHSLESRTEKSDISSILSVSSFPLQDRSRSRERVQATVDGLSIERLTLLGKKCR